MATVPNCDQSIVEIAKVVDYLLSRSHPIGRAKAQFFMRFGFRESAPDELVQALLAHVRDNAVADTDISAYGTKYRVDGPLASPDARDPLVSTVWMVLNGETIPRFITAFRAKVEAMMQPLDTVILTRDIPQQKLRKGDLGAVVLVHPDGAAYEVEFVTLDGQTLAVITLSADAVRTATGREIAHAREVA